MEGNFKLGYGIEFDINAGNVSDATYLEEYNFGEKSDLNTDVSLGKILVKKICYLTQN